MKAAAGPKTGATEWATLAAGVLTAFEKQDKLGLSAFVSQYAEEVGVGTPTLWRHVGAFKFWEALRKSGDYGELPTAEGIQEVVTAGYLTLLNQSAQNLPLWRKRRLVRAICDGQPIRSSDFAAAATPLPRGRGATAKNIERMRSQPQFDAAALIQSIMERMPAWSASGNPADSEGHLLASDLGKMPQRLGKPDALFFLVNEPQTDDDAQLIRLGAFTLVPPDLVLGDQLKVLELAQHSMKIGQSWLGFSRPPEAKLCDVAKAAGIGVLLHDVVDGEVRVDVLVPPKEAAANPYMRELVLSKFLRMPANVVMTHPPKDPKASGGPKLG